MPEVLIPVGPGDRAEWVERTLTSAVAISDKVTVYDNSEREDLRGIIEKFNVKHVVDRRMRKVNMAMLRNRLLSLATEDLVIMMDSDVVIKSAKSLLSRVAEQGYAYTWMHYAYTEEELGRPRSPGEENPNLGCAAINLKDVKEIGMFDEKYERDEDIWLYSKLKHSGKRVGPVEERCLHLNTSHLRKDLSSSLREARRNLWRSKYDMMMVFDGLADFTFLTGYSYFGSYYVIGLLSALIPLASLLYIPVIGYGVKYYGGVKEWAYNLIPGLALAISLPYGLCWNLLKMRSRRKGGVTP
ncbi:glycosyltransferase family 2 protein [Metallosphaera tengchongensis]|uniref:Glycosyltransferase family 2 protein n=1 Tax=Metallosphaera tengchongensis TaxID=1532350 RepID=A0A6N0NZB2_9CREN|nr:glycosyltransferase family A protein [Metallosphaera tengchongensis]QKR00879.1 glycosyltransferase family 2 protein [Metallosphaera tengchongensis]